MVAKAGIDGNLCLKLLEAIHWTVSDSYIYKTGMDVVFDLTLQCNPPAFSYSTKTTKNKFQDFQQELCWHEAYPLLHTSNSDLLQYKNLILAYTLAEWSWLQSSHMYQQMYGKLLSLSLTWQEVQAPV